MSIERRNKWTARAGRLYVVIVRWNDEGQESRIATICTEDRSLMYDIVQLGMGGIIKSHHL